MERNLYTHPSGCLESGLVKSENETKNVSNGKKSYAFPEMGTNSKLKLELQ